MSILERLETEIMNKLNLDSAKYIKSDDIAKYFVGSKNGQQIKIKLVSGRIFIRNKENWDLVHGMFIE